MWRKTKDLPPGQAAEVGKINFMIISFLLYNQIFTSTFYHENKNKFCNNFMINLVFVSNKCTSLIIFEMIKNST
jgi:hypothetical protein